MAIRLLITLIALGLLHLRPHLWERGDLRFLRVLRGWVKQLSTGHGSGRLILILAIPLLLCTLLIWLLSWLPLTDLLQFIFGLIVLLFCLGPRTYEADMAAILRADNSSDRETAAQALAENGRYLPWRASELGVAMTMTALRRRFSVLFWFFLFGPVGALLYRLSRSLGHDTSLGLDSKASEMARQFAHILEWLPAQLLVFSLAFVGHFEAVTTAWRHWHQLARPDDWYRAGPGFLTEAARADIFTDMESEDPDSEKCAATWQEMQRLHAALQRALLLWLSLVALIVVTHYLF